MVIYIAGLQNIPKELNEAALIDGASSLSILKNIKIWVQFKKKYAIMFGMCMGKINLKAKLISDEENLNNEEYSEDVMVGIKYFADDESLKIVGLVFLLNLAFGFIVYFIGENNISAFLDFNKYLTPIFATLIGLIPNCASSIIITNLYVSSAISFGTLLSGLLVNAGMGLLIIFKRKDMLKDNLIVLLTLILVAIIFGYIASFIIGF